MFRVQDFRDRCGEVLVPTDLTSASSAALEWANRYCREHSARLHLIHVLNLSGWAMDFVDQSTRVRRKMHNEAARRLSQLSSAPSLAGLEVTWEVAWGEPCRQILDAVEALDADLIVTGRTHRYGLEHLLLPRFTEHLLQRARCPIVTVGPTWTSRPGRERSVLVATDLSSDGDKALVTGVELLDWPSETTNFLLLHAYQVPYACGADGLPVSQAAAYRQRCSAETSAAAHVERLAHLIRESGRMVEVLSAEGNPTELILSTARSRQVDIILTACHGRSGLGHLLMGSTTLDLVQEVACPVLCVPRRTRRSRARRTRERVTRTALMR